MNTFLTLDLIFFILVAVFLIIRLRGVLGRRTGNEKRPKDIFMYQDTTLDTDKKKILDGKQSIKSKFHNKLSTEKENNLNKNTALEKIYYIDKSFSPKKKFSLFFQTCKSKNQLSTCNHQLQIVAKTEQLRSFGLKP